jgi:hypothetical protein
MGHKEAGVPCRRYTKEFKIEAVRLGQSVGYSEASRRLGMPDDPARASSASPESVNPWAVSRPKAADGPGPTAGGHLYLAKSGHLYLALINVG